MTESALWADSVKTPGTAGNGWALLEMAGIAGNGWKWLEMAGNC